jgi:hypothetical protein
VRREGELQVGVALPSLVQRLGGMVVPLDRRLDRLAREQLGKVELVERGCAGPCEELLAHRLARRLDGPAGDVGLARGRR